MDRSIVCVSLLTLNLLYCVVACCCFQCLIDFQFSVLHEMKLSHTDLKPENMLFVNSDCNVTYNSRMVSTCFFYVFLVCRIILECDC